MDNSSIRISLLNKIGMHLYCKLHYHTNYYLSQWCTRIDFDLFLYFTILFYVFCKRKLTVSITTVFPLVSPFIILLFQAGILPEFNPNLVTCRFSIIRESLILNYLYLSKDPRDMKSTANSFTRKWEIMRFHTFY